MYKKDTRQVSIKFRKNGLVYYVIIRQIVKYILSVLIFVMKSNYPKLVQTTNYTSTLTVISHSNPSSLKVISCWWCIFISPDVFDRLGEYVYP